MVKKHSHLQAARRAAWILCAALAGFSAAGCAKQAPSSDKTAAMESKRATACAKLPDSVDAAAFRAAYEPLVPKRELLALVDPEHALPKDYQPQDLTGSGKIRLRQETMEWMEKMQAAAQKDGVHLYPISAFRTYEYQQGLLARTKNPAYVARPGHSQHQLGTAVDFNTVNPRDEDIPALKWLRKHAGEYGFSLSFPKGQEQETGYPHEAWHYRYITREGVKLQDEFFGGSQHKTLKFLRTCLWEYEPQTPGKPEAPHNQDSPQTNR